MNKIMTNAINELTNEKDSDFVATMNDLMKNDCVVAHVKSFTNSIEAVKSAIIDSVNNW